jgi:hypothetical protein
MAIEVIAEVENRMLMKVLFYVVVLIFRPWKPPVEIRFYDEWIKTMKLRV